MTTWTSEQIIKKLHTLANPDNVKGMARYEITSHNNLGISIYQLRPLAKQIGKHHTLALELWDTGIHDARLLAVFLDDPALVTPEQMDHWAEDFDSWDVCDQACTSLFDLTAFAYKKIYQWSDHEKEFVKRAAFSLIAGLSVHDNHAPDKEFEQFFPLILKYADDDRNYVKKAVNWALRNIGKRNQQLNKKAITIAQKMQKKPEKSARWIANDALRELTSEHVQKRLERKKKK